MCAFGCQCLRVVTRGMYMYHSTCNSMSMECRVLLSLMYHKILRTCACTTNRNFFLNMYIAQPSQMPSVPSGLLRNTNGKVSRKIDLECFNIPLVQILTSKPFSLVTSPAKIQQHIVHSSFVTNLVHTKSRTKIVLQW